MKLLSVIVVLVLLAPVLTSCKKLVQPKDCSDIHHQVKTRRSGVYTIYPLGKTSAVQVYCDMVSQGGRWTVFQRRMDGTLNFYRPWHQYKMGFGRAAGEYWLGLDNIHQLTHQRKSELLVDMEFFTGKKVFARYSSFSVESECDGYVLHVSGFKNGGAGDGMTYHNKKKFSTFDKDQDTHSTDNCARLFLGAFWYGNCYHANPNGVYLWRVEKKNHAIGAVWFSHSLKSISMKIRPVK